MTNGMRTCIGCNTCTSKGQLYRVCCSDGSVFFDGRGTASGRGAYVCSVDCFKRAVQTGRLAAALRCKVNKNQAKELLRNIEVESERLVRS